MGAFYNAFKDARRRARLQVSDGDRVLEVLVRGTFALSNGTLVKRRENKVQELISLITKAQSGDLEAHDQIVRQFQDMAVAYAYFLTKDFHRAEDAAQEAFIEAFCCLPNLQEPLAFPAWLRRIIFKHCDRVMRKKQINVVALDAGLNVPSASPELQQALEQRETATQVRNAIALLPQHERVVVLLFYMGCYSQQQIAEFIQVPVSTIKKRLYTARKKLKEKMMQMNQEAFEEQRPSRNSDFADGVKSFTTQFSQMINSGQSIVRSLFKLANQQQNADLRQIIAQIQHDITGDGKCGATLSQAMSKHPDVFSQTYVDAIQQGENKGNLADVLQQLAKE